MDMFAFRDNHPKGLSLVVIVVLFVALALASVPRVSLAEDPDAMQGEEVAESNSSESDGSDVADETDQQVKDQVDESDGDDGSASDEVDEADGLYSPEIDVLIGDDGWQWEDPLLQPVETEDFGLQLMSSDWKSILANNYSKAKQLAGRSSFNGYCSLAVSYELWAYGITNPREAMGNGVDAAAHFSGGGTTTGGYSIAYTGGSTSAGWSPFDQATNNGTTDGIYIMSYTSTSSVYGHVSFFVLEGGTVYITESYGYSGNPEGTGMAFSYSSFKSQWSRYYPNVTGVVRFFTGPVNHDPIACFDGAEGGEGTVHVTGWAFDPDDPSASLTMHVYVGGNADSGEGHVITANVPRQDVNNAYGIAGNHGFDVILDTSMRGYQPVVIYAINVPGSNSNPPLEVKYVTIANKESVPPVISDVQVSDVNPAGYTITCRVTDNVGVDRVQFPTWTSENGQDDLAGEWWTNPAVSGTRSGDTWTFRVNASDHNGELGSYATDIYAYDAAGNAGKYATVVANLEASTDLPEGRYYIVNNKYRDRVVDVYGSSTEDGANVLAYQKDDVANQHFDVTLNDDSTYTIVAEHSGKAVEVPGASRDNGASIKQCVQNGSDAQRWYAWKADDGTWLLRNKATGYMFDIFQENGGASYDVRQYRYNGLEAQRWLFEKVDNTPPVISDIRITDVTPAGYTIVYKVTDNVGVSYTKYTAWTTYNGKDDYPTDWDTNSLYYVGRRAYEDYLTFSVKVDRHNGELGEYATEIYAYDTAGNTAKSETIFVNLEATTDLLDGVYHIRNRNFPSRILDIKDASLSDGATAVTNEASDTESQLFIISRNDDSSYTIVAKHTGMALQPLDNPKKQATRIGQSALNGSDVQRWYIWKTEDGFWKISNKFSGFMFNQCEGGDYHIAQDYYDNTSVNKQWKFEEIDIKHSIESATIGTIQPQQYNGNPLKPKPLVKYGETTLQEGVDYTISYKDNTKVGTATITIIGKGSYEGTKSSTFIIVAPDISTATVSSIPNQVYVGTELRPTPTVVLAGRTLSNGTDYVLSYKDNVNVGTATVTIAGKGNYSGTKDVTFGISWADVSEATVSEIPDQTYTGLEFEPTPTVVLGGRTLAYGTDYTLSYKRNVRVGSAVITITGQGNYTGTKKATFEIVQADISGATVSAIPDQIYTGLQFRPYPSVVLGGRILSNGTDYTLSYRDNVNAGTATVTVTGCVNYTGTKEVTFRITAADISGATVSTIPDQSYTGSYIKPNPTIKVGNRTLKSGTDYELSYWNNMAVGTATIKITGTGNYGGSTFATFNIVKAPPRPVFSDVTDATPHADDIYWLAEAGVSEGWGEPDGTRTFRGALPVLRQDMAAFLYRLAGSPAYVPTPADVLKFSDVNASTPHATEIWWLASARISEGWGEPDGTRTFRGTSTVKRQDMAAFLRRLCAKMGGDASMPLGATNPFSDVSSATPHAEDVLWLAGTGISEGWGEPDGSRTFRGTADVVRQDMAAFLRRLDAYVRRTRG